MRLGAYALGMYDAWPWILLATLFMANALPSNGNLQTANGPSQNNPEAKYLQTKVKGTIPAFKCPKAGFFSVTGSCNHFYICHETPGVGLFAEFSTCPEGSIFDIHSESCKLPMHGISHSCFPNENVESQRLDVNEKLPFTSLNVQDIPNLLRSKRMARLLPRLMDTGHERSVIYNTFESEDKSNIDLTGIENKLEGIEAKLHGISLQLLESQTEKKISSQVTKNLISNLNSEVLETLIAERNAANEQKFTRVQGNIQQLQEFIIQEVNKTKSEIKRGYTSMSREINRVQMEPIISKLLTLIRDFNRRLHHLLELPEKNKKDEIERSGGYIDFIQSSTLQETLYDIIQRRFAIPKDTSDLSAIFIFDLLVDGLQIHERILSSLVLSNAYLASKALEEKRLDDFNTYMLRISSSISIMKLELGFDDEHGLIKEVNNTIEIIKQLPFHSQMSGLDDLLKEKSSILVKLKSDMTQFIGENTQLNTPEQVSRRPDFSSSSIPLPVGPWVNGKEVSYAIQHIMSSEGVSAVGEWSRPYTITDKANPIIQIPSSKDDATRLVYRKFIGEKPELVAKIADNMQTSFRDTTRDLINAASRLNQGLAVKEVELLLNDGADVNDTLENDMTPLHYAAKYNNVEVLKILVQEKADIQAKSTYGENGLHFAASLGSTEALEYLMDEGTYVDAQIRSSGWSPLHIAVLKDRANAVQSLIKNGSFINIKDNAGSTPLHLSVLGKGKTLEILLGENTIDVNAKDNGGQTPLHHAVKVSSISSAKQLLEHPDTEVDTLSDSFMSPLHYAAITGNVEIITELLKHNASITLPDEGGSTPLHYAAFYGNTEATLLIKLLDQSLSIVQNTNEETPLGLALRHNNANVIHILRDETDMVQNDMEASDDTFSSDKPEVKYSLQSPNCTEEIVQEIAVHSEEICSQIGYITNYAEVIMSKIPVPIRHREKEELTHVINDYNTAIQNARQNVYQWDNQDSILLHIQKSFELAKNFEEEFNRKHNIIQDNFLSISQNVNKEEIIKKIREEIVDLENSIQATQSALSLASATVVKTYLQNQIRNLQAELLTKQQMMSTDFAALRKLEEFVYFLELVHNDAKKVMQSATNTKVRMSEFQGKVNVDKMTFERIGHRTKSSLRNLQHQSILNNQELKAIDEQQQRLLAEIGGFKQKISSLYDDIHRTNKELSGKRRQLLAKFERVSRMRTIATFLFPIGIISKPLMYFANLEERRLIKSWEANLERRRQESNRIKSIISLKEDLIIQHRETIANGSQNSQALVSELNAYNNLVYDLETIKREFPSMPPAMIHTITGLRKIEDAFTHVMQQLGEMMLIGQVASTNSEKQQTMEKIHEQLATLQCYWKGSSLYIANIKECSRVSYFNTIVE